MNKIFSFLFLFTCLCACNSSYEVIHHAKGYYVDSAEVNYRSTNFKPSFNK